MKKYLLSATLSALVGALLPVASASAQKVEDADVRRVFGTSGEGAKKTELWGRVDLGLRYAPTNLAPSVAASTTTFTPTVANLQAAQVLAKQSTFSLTDASQGRFGFRGTTGPLMGGVQGIFNLEARFNGDDGTTRTDSGSSGQFFRDKSFAGLITPYGVFTFGRQSGVADIMTSGRYEAFGGDSYASNGTRAAQALVKQDNSIYYLSPRFMGFTGHAHLALAERKAVTIPFARAAENGYGLGLDYVNGPLSLSAGAQKDSLIGASSATGTNLAVDNRGTIVLGGSYDFKVVKLVSTFARTQGMNNAGTGSSKVMTFGAKVPMGPGEIRASYAMRRDDRINVNSGSTNAGTPGTTLNTVSFSSDQESNKLGLGYFLPMGASNSLNFSLVFENQKRFFTANQGGVYRRVPGTSASGQGVEVSYRLVF